MGISRLTALIIATNEVVVDVAGPKKGKWMGAILKKGDRFEPLLSTDYYYDSKVEAKKAMEDLVTELRRIIEAEGGANKVVDKAFGIGNKVGACDNKSEGVGASTHEKTST